MHPYAYMGPAGLMKELVKSSHFINFVYWRLSRVGVNGQNDTYADWLKSQFNDPDVMNTHKTELEYIVKIADVLKAKVIVVLFPFLTHVDESKGILQKVKNVFQGHNIPVLEVLGIVSGMKVKDRVVNKIDCHPSVKLHKLIAEELYPMILEKNAEQVARRN